MTSVDQRQVRAGQDRQADDVDALLERGVDDLRRRQPDALVDHLDAGCRAPGPRSARRRSSARRGPACRPGLDAPPEPRAGAPRPPRAPRRGCRPRAPPPCRRRSARGTRRTPRACAAPHSPVVTPAFAAGDRGRHHVRARRAPRPAAPPAPPRPPPRRARRATRCSRAICSASTAGSTDQDAAVAGGERRRLGLGEAVDADHHLSRRPRSRASRAVLAATSARLHVARSRATAPPIASMRASSARAPSFSASTLASTTGLPSKRSPYSSRSVS